jgi:N-acetyl-anhydromuramyl-L-alanine amidase AmpD
MTALWHPDALKVVTNNPPRGKYLHSYPIGAVVHYTAGHIKKGSAQDMLISTSRKGIGVTFGIDYDGSLHQAIPLDHWGGHAGESSWPGIEGRVSSHLVGIEVCCGGKLVNGKTWYGRNVPDTDIRIVVENGVPVEYERFSKDQEDSLLNLLVWLKTNNPSVFKACNVVGHNEVSPGRKSDPGGSLSMSMDYIRKFVENY